MSSTGSTAQAAVGGLPGAIHAIFEDREGNIWLGGTKGLMQLRDASFLSYQGLAPEGGSLFVDASGTGWVAPSSGAGAKRDAYPNRLTSLRSGRLNG